MKIKKMMLVGLILLAVLTIGAVSASQNMTSDDLAVDDESGETMEVSVDEDDYLGEMNEDDVDIEVNDIDTNQPSENFTTLSVSEKDGSFVIYSQDNDDNYVEFYNWDLADREDCYEDNGRFYLGVSFNDMADFLDGQGKGDFDNELLDDTLYFAFRYGGDELVTRTYTVEFEDEFIHLNEKVITRDNLNCWIPWHESINNGEATICDVDPFDVREGTLIITITKPDGETESGRKTIGEDGEYDGHIRWYLDDFELEDTGDYTVNVTYSKGDNEFSWESEMALLEFNYAVCDNVYIVYPFDVIRFYSDDEDGESEPSHVRVYVDGEEMGYYGENPFRWTLKDLEISTAGEYDICIEAYRGDEAIENFTYALNVFDEVNGFIIYSNQLGMESWDLDNPAVYVMATSSLGDSFRLFVYNQFIDEHEFADTMTWSLDYLGITSNGGYNVRICDEEDREIGSTWFDVRGIISADSFRSWVSGHERYDNNDNPWVVNVHGHDGISEGTVKVTIEDSKGFSKTYYKSFEDDADDCNDVIWRLDDLSDVLVEPGVYAFNVSYINDEMPIDLITDFTFTLTRLEYNVYEGDISIDYPFEVLRCWDEDVNVKVYVNEHEGPFSSEASNPYRWTLSDLGINGAGEYNITVKSYDPESDEQIEEFNFTLNVHDEIVEPEFITPIDVQSWNMEGDVLYVAFPDDCIGEEYTLKINNEWDIPFEVTNSLMGFDLNALGIDCDGGYQIELYDDDGWVCDTGLNVWCLDGTRIQIDFWDDEDERGTLYTDCEEHVIWVSVPESFEGTLHVFVNGEEKDSWEIEFEEGENWAFHGWSLEDLGIHDADTYSVEVKLDEETIDEATLNVTQWDEDSFRVNVDYDDGVKFLLYCPEGSQGKVIRVNIENDDGNHVVEDKEIEIESEDCGGFRELVMSDYVGDDGNYHIFINVNDGEFIYSNWFGIGEEEEGGDFNYIEVWDSENPIYTDNPSNVVSFETIEFEGMLDLIVNGEVKYHTIVSSGNYYNWNLELLGITEAGDYNVTLNFNDDERIEEYWLHVRDFDNSTFRVQVIGDDEPFYLYLFTPQGATGTVTMTFKHWDDDIERLVEDDNMTFELDESYWNKWVMITDYMNADSDHVDVDIDGEEIPVEYGLQGFQGNGGNYFEVRDEEIRHLDDTVITVYANVTDNDYTINITSGDFSFFRPVSELGDYEWCNGNYRYFITLDGLDSFAGLDDKARILISYDTGGGKALANRWVPAATYVLERNDDYIRVHGYEALRVDLIKFEFAHNDEEEEQEEEGDGEGSDLPDGALVRITVPDSLNIHETAILHIAYGGGEITKNLNGLYSEYDYNCLGVAYYITLDDLDLEALKDNDMVNFSVTSNDDFIGSRCFIMVFDEEEGWGIDNYPDSIALRLYYGQIGHLEFGQGEDSNEIIGLAIPHWMNITEGAVIITDENGEIIFSKSLSEFDENHTYVSAVDRGYWISDEISEFNYTIFKENVPFTVSFTYANTTIDFARGIRQDDKLLRIATLRDVSDYYKISLSEGILINGSDSALIIEATDSANRQSIRIDLGGGYFIVYVNGKKVENLGRLVGYDGETELELFLLQRASSDGTVKATIYLADINITDNGFYNIKVVYHPDSGGDTNSAIEVELFNKNITLTSNVKVDNVTSEVYTGFGFDPILLYLDTYYGDINETSGTITVLNADNETIFTSDIKSLSAEKGRYYLKYSDFKNKDFGDKITVMYGDGNERSGSTVVDVTWKDVNATDFTPAVNDDVNDYYADFISMNIPDLLDSGQIIVTIKYKNQHASPIANMNVTTDFDSQAVYVFNVADIKAAYGNDFSLAMSDLGFFESNGDYDIDVKFTAGEDRLNVTEKTVEVALWDEILINVNETTRYTIALPFAGVRVFEPINAYAELYIDGVLYSHKVFENGQITFTSSPSWTAGTHTANITVYDSEFGVVLNTTQVTFEVSTASDDVTVTVPENVKEDKDVILSITVPEAGIVTIRIDGNEPENHTLVSGANSVNLGKLAYGNRTLYVLYENAEGTSYYNNYINVFVGDDGRWLNFPDPIVLNDVDTVTMNFGLDATGIVSVFIDDRFIKNVTVENGLASFKIDESLFDENANDNLLGASDEKTKYGLHNYTLRYSGDGTHDPLTKSGTFTVAYIFKDDLKEDYPLMEDYEFTVTLPEDANGTVTLTNGNEVKTAPVVNGKATFNLENLGMGEHRIAVKYSGDDRYPEAEYETVLKVGHYGVIGEYSDTKKFVSLLLPANATGNLTVFNDNMHQVLASIPMVGGKARFDLSNLPVGIYEVMAYYEGDDYDVKSFYLSFRVMPKVIISQGVIMGDNANIYLDLDNATGHVVIAMDGLQPVVQNITDGIVNYTFSTEGYFYGNHTVTFLYFGKSFDGYIFYEEDGRTPIGYDMLILARNTTGEITSNGQYVEACIYDDEGNIAYDANGTVTFFINGVKVAVVDIVDGIAKLDISQYKNGRYLVRWEYSGNNKYASSSGESNMDINGQAARIAAADASIAYSSAKKYSVTVYMADGKPAGNVDVSFLVNGKIYKTVKTDSKGVAAVLISKAPGSYKITAKASDVSVTKTLKVNHILTLKKAKVKRSAKKLVIKATLKKVDGKFLKAKKITLKFNGKKFTAKTNKKGVAKFTIKAKVLKKLKAGKKVTYQATYLKDTVKKVVKVKK